MAGRAPRIGLLPAPRHGGSRGRFAVVAGRFNEAVSKRLVDGAVAALAAHGVTGPDLEVHWVPGSFELGQAARALAVTGRFAAIVCVGVVIKGATPHFDYVCAAAAHGITQAALATGIPITFGVITALTEEQAWERAGGPVGNRGEEAALAAIEMAELIRNTKGSRAGKQRKAK
jgi:6,7-dimethyl-8-ribityllumazine synthase